MQTMCLIDRNKLLLEMAKDNWTWEDLAWESGYSDATVRKLGRRYCKIETAQDIADTIGVPLEDIAIDTKGIWGGCNKKVGDGFNGKYEKQYHFNWDKFVPLYKEMYGTQYALADAAGVAQNTITHLRIRYVLLPTVIKICKALGVEDYESLMDDIQVRRWKCQMNKPGNPFNKFMKDYVPRQYDKTNCVPGTGRRRSVKPRLEETTRGRRLYGKN